MASLTIRNLPDEVVQRIKTLASMKGHSMEQEVRELLETRYASKSEAIQRIRQRWSALPETTPQEVDSWRVVGRHNDY
ncbi:hypothetical protein [cf. Phormidesmis sp. LEGE 11477]|uniref:FitA-like ribbon-helix-helix domain-containing protein n=1 Tax=cf. Phormidesmis sp. LEGE 11477 TaxID=1828680 RepID=UPI00188241EF|nr:hypothetical protein [cf. Phormidesmis sp. LEGE 11477]MBE9063512.1 hypothetical protein [cf. Phormidesmis sp. LEGE 11477]